MIKIKKNINNLKSNEPFPLNFRNFIPSVDLDLTQDKYFRVVSYNILCDSLMSVSINIPEDKLKNYPYLDWSKRKQVILDEIKVLNPDILCLQEFERDENLIKEFGSLGYNV